MMEGTAHSQEPRGEEARPVKRGRGMLMGVALLGAIAAIAAILLLPSGIESNESRARKAMRAYVTAQEKYRRRSGKASFATTLSELKGLLPDEVVAAHGHKGKPYAGYRFLEMKSFGGMPIKWEFDFALCAVPAEYGRSGRRTFIVATNGLVVHKDRPSAMFLADHPIDDDGSWSCKP